MYELGVNRADFQAVVAEILNSNNLLRFRARGASMYPFIRDGDVIEVQPIDASAVRCGDVVLCQWPNGRVVAHRVIQVCQKKGEEMLLIQGDAVTCPDGFISGEQVLGRVVAIERRGKRIERGGVLQQLMGMLWVELSPFSRRLYHALATLRRRMRCRLPGGSKGR